MKAFHRIFSAVPVILLLAGLVAAAAPRASRYDFRGADRPLLCKADTVTYPHDSYKIGRRGDFTEIDVVDSLLRQYRFRDFSEEEKMALDTIKVPDSLKFTDPFRYKYYIALLDSLTHLYTRDSLLQSVKNFYSKGDTLRARADSADRYLLDSLYARDSSIRAREAFLAWYNSLDKQARKKYDKEQEILAKVEIKDSLRAIQEEKKAYKDSVRDNTPRVLETFVLPDSMQYKRIIAWKLDQNFQKVDPYRPDTSFNYYYNDMKFLREDVNGTWLGVSGTPVQTYDYTKRAEKETGPDFMKSQETWTFNPSTIPMYNTKTPYTELAYWGTLFSTRSKESDNIHFMTTQNILPSLNFSILYDSWGGEGLLVNEKSDNKTFYINSNYLGKKYSMHVGFIHNKVSREENGGIVRTDSEGRSGTYWVRDTTVEAKEIPVSLTDASSETNKNTIYLNQQLRIPFNFISRSKAKKDSTFVFNADSLDRDITSAFIGHNSEITFLNRKYVDNVSSDYARDFYKDKDGNYVHNYSESSSLDSLYNFHLDNKIFLKLQPWAEDGAISKIDVGIGDLYDNWFLQSPTASRQGQNVGENSIYLYAGAEGQIKKYVKWDAVGSYTLIGHRATDFSVGGNFKFNIYPWRKRKDAPMTFDFHAETSLTMPDFYQRNFNGNHFSWSNDFKQVSVTKFQGGFSVPHWNLEARATYSLIGNHVYYDNWSLPRQESSVINVLTVSLTKNFNIANILHLDNRVLFQMSSNQTALPLPMLAFNLRYYFQFVLARDRATRQYNVMVMQIGANGLYNTPWYAPGWNPNAGVYYNQTTEQYTNGPIIDVFVNVQWKRACIFLKVENIGKGWPLQHKDYFSADRYVVTQQTFKIGIFWPFYILPNKNPEVSAE